MCFLYTLTSLVWRVVFEGVKGWLLLTQAVFCKRNDGIKSIHLSDGKLSNHFVILVGTQCALIQFGTCCKWAAPGMCMLPWLVNLQEKKIVSRKKCYGDVKEI